MVPTAYLDREVAAVAAAPMSNGACEPPKKMERENNVE